MKALYRFLPLPVLRVIMEDKQMIVAGLNRIPLQEIKDVDIFVPSLFE